MLIEHTSNTLKLVNMSEWNNYFISQQTQMIELIFHNETLI